MKLTKRKGFNFFRSYFDVYNELETPEDKLAFIDALLQRQFLGIKPDNLKGMARFAYISQTNSIDSQVKGYEDKTKTRLDGTPYSLSDEAPQTPPTEPPCQGVKTPPTEQVEEKEEEKGKGEVEEKAISDVFFTIEKCKEKYLADERLLKAVSDNPQNKITIEEIPNRIVEFNKHLLENGEATKEYRDYCSHFKNWHKANKKATTPQKRRFL